MEAARDPEFLPHDGPLREDVRRLGTLVGQMLAEQGGQAFYERVEHVRTTAIHRRRSGAAVDALAEPLTGLEAADAEALARAFATYFQAVNTAERVHRIRRRRDYQREGGAPQPESLAAVLGRLKKDGVSRDELTALLGRLDVEPVFTAHPTEAVRRSLLEKEQEIVRALVDEFDPTRTPQELRDDDARILMALSAGWQTAEASPVRPSVQDEFDHVGFYIARPIYRVLPALYEALEQAIAETYGEGVTIPRLLRFATWVGGDMDGNPNVNAETIAATLGAQRSLVLERYLDDTAELGRLLSQTDDRVALDDRLARRLERYREDLPEAAAAIRPRHADMPYRSFLKFVAARLEATLHEQPVAYASAEEFIDDIALVEKSLVAHGGKHAGAYAVGRLLWRARTFGFHLARLDVRQDARVHDEALSALLDDAEFANHDTPSRVKALRPYAAGERSFVTGDDNEAATMRASATVRKPPACISSAWPKAPPTCSPCWHWHVAADSSKTAASLSTSPRCSKRSTIWPGAPRRCRPCSTTRSIASISRRVATANGSCSAIRTVARMAARWPRSGASSEPRSTSSRWRRKPASAWRSFTVAAARPVAAVRVLHLRSWPRHAVPSVACYA
jgi:phosphoenolpyruvate carboxylase